MSQRPFDRDRLIFNRDQSRCVDQAAINEFGMHSLVLMENAGRQCCEQLLKRGVSGPVIICCGTGNNGGDGFVIARHLRIAGVQVKVIVAGSPEKMSDDAGHNFAILQKTGCSIVILDQVSMQDNRDVFAKVENQNADWIVDAMLGTGAVGPSRSPIRECIQLCNSIDCRLMSIDLPSGIDCDTGVTDGVAIQSDVNCTFVSKKPAHMHPHSQPHFGEVVVLDIGVPDEVIVHVQQSNC